MEGQGSSISTCQATRQTSRPRVPVCSRAEATSNAEPSHVGLIYTSFEGNAWRLEVRSLCVCARKRVCVCVCGSVVVLYERLFHQVERPRYISYPVICSVFDVLCEIRLASCLLPALCVSLKIILYSSLFIRTAALVSILLGSA